MSFDVALMGMPLRHNILMKMAPPTYTATSKHYGHRGTETTNLMVSWYHGG